MAIEQGWYKRMTKTKLYLYEFEPTNFYLQDQTAGFYVSEKVEKPISVTEVDDLFAALFDKNVEVRILDSLWPLGDAVQKSTLYWSLCRMRNANSRCN